MWSANELYGISSIYCFFFFFSCSSSSYSSSSSSTYYYYYYYKWGCHACEARVGQIHILVEYGQPLFVWLSRDWPSVRTYVHTYVRAGGGKLLPIHSLKWNPNDVFQTISKGLASGFVYWSCALSQKPQINGLEKKQKHGSRRRDCFSLLYFGNSQIYWFYVAFQT